MHVELIATLLHPGDLSLGDWAALLGMFAAFIILPVVILGFIIFKVINRHSLGGAGRESQETITLGLNDSKGKRLP